MYIGDQKNTRVCQCGDCLNIMERIKITGESQKKREERNPNSDTRSPSHGAGLAVVW